MNPNPQRAQPDHGPDDRPEIPATNDEELVLDSPLGEFDPSTWDHQVGEAHGVGGRQVLGGTLGFLAIFWLAYVAWISGRALGDAPLSSPELALWIAAAAGPLGLLGLAWLMFGRTRRKESERFTHSVIAMRSEVQSLEALLEVLSQRIRDSRNELGAVSQNLMMLGDEATRRMSDVSREFNASSEQLMRNGEALDRAAESARNDIAVLLGDLPQAEQTTRALAGQLEAIHKVAEAAS